MGDNPKADEKNWPGLEPKPDEVTYSADKLKNIAIDLAGDFEILAGTGTGSLQDFTTNSMVMKLGDDEWPAGKSFFDAVYGGNEAFRTIYGQMINEYRNAIGLLLTGAKDFEALNLLMSGQSLTKET